MCRCTVSQTCACSPFSSVPCNLMAQVVKKSACNAGDPSLIPGSGRSPGGGYGNPLQYSCLENPMDRGAWQALVHGITKSQTLSNLTPYFHLCNPRIQHGLSVPYLFILSGCRNSRSLQVRCHWLLPFYGVKCLHSTSFFPSDLD